MHCKPSITRRHFLAASSCLLATGTRNCLSATDGVRLPLGIQMYSLRKFPVDAALDHAAKAGFAHVEFYKGMLPVDASDELIAEIKRKVNDHGLAMSAHGVNRFGTDSKANEKVFQFAQKIGIKNITADPTPEAFDQLDELVQEFNIRIAIHNHGPRSRYSRVVDVLRAIENHDERIGACADLGHFIRSGEEPTEVIRLLKGRLYGIHLKDFAEMKEDAEGVILGQGHLDVAGVVDALLAVDFPSDGALSLEYEENPEDPIADIQACQRIAAAAIKQATRVRS